jgi:predicted DNA-binding transcriptional regulator AlpA
MACVEVGMMRPKKILRRKEAITRLGCGKTKFYTDYEYRDGCETTIPGTSIPRLRRVRLGPRNHGFLEGEVDSLVDAIAALRDATPEQLGRIERAWAEAKAERARRKAERPRPGKQAAPRPLRCHHHAQEPDAD